jgi:F-type H+-transporting ATPase subunit delta
VIGSAVGRRYGRAVFESATRAGTVEPVGADLAAIVALLEAEPALRRFLASPRVTEAEKTALFQRHLGPRVEKLTLSLLELLVDKRRVADLGNIAFAYHELVREAQGLVEARVITAHPLEPATGEAIRKQLERITGKHVTVLPEIDPSLLGGVKVMIGQKVIDGSVAFHMKRLREALVAVRVH